MLKKNITYQDLDGKTVTEEFTFHLSKAELVEMEVEHQGGLSAYLTRIVESEDGAQIIKAFKNLIVRSYGKRSEDGRRFIKNSSLVDEFMETEAYSSLFMELATNAEAAADFVNGILPEGLDKDLEKLSVDTTPAPAQQQRAVAEATPYKSILSELEDADREMRKELQSKQMTRAQAIAMDGEELKQRMQDGWVIIQ